MAVSQEEKLKFKGPGANRRLKLGLKIWIEDT